MSTGAQIRTIAAAIVFFVLAANATAATVIRGADPSTLATFPERLWSGVALPWIDRNPPPKSHVLYYQQTDPTLGPILMRKHKHRAVEVSEKQ